ncbi:extracellular solute-binding protein [Sphingomonas aerolata]|uniref:extracellular solute-binding protein n=1 Tax=Sphingomonas aerolata TaxID=185951 RepID=UPI002FE2EBEF
MSYEGDYSPMLMPAFTAATGIPVDVQSLPATAAHEKLLTAQAGGAMPDVLMLYTGWVQEFATIAAIAPVPSPAMVADLFPEVLDATRVGGRDFAVPWSVAPQVQFYRRDILARAGYSEPAGDWDGWLRMGHAIKRQRPDDFVFMLLLNWPDMLITMLGQTGATMLRDHDSARQFPDAGGRCRVRLLRACIFAEGLAPKRSRPRSRIRSRRSRKAISRSGRPGRRRCSTSIDVPRRSRPSAGRRRGSRVRTTSAQCRG